MTEPDAPHSTDAADPDSRAARDARTIEPAPRSTSPDDSMGAPSAIVKGRARRMRTIVVGAVVVVAAIGVTAWVVDRRATKASEQRISVAWSSTARCLLGEPLKPAERPSVRFRRIQLVAQGLPPEKRRGTDGEPWPATCAQYAYELDRALQDGKHTPKRKVGEPPAINATRDLAFWAESLAKTLQHTPKTDAIDLSEPIEHLWERADAEKIPDVPVPAVPMPPEPANALTVETLAKVQPLSEATFSLQKSVGESHSDRSLHLAFEGSHPPSTRRLCTVDASGARCASPPEKLSAAGALQLLGTSEEGVAPLLFAGKRGDRGIFRSDDGERLEAMTTFGAVVRKDRSVLVLGPVPAPPPKEAGNAEAEADSPKPAKKDAADDKVTKTSRLRLLRYPPTGASSTTILPLPPGADPKLHTATLLWDWVLWKTLKEGQTHLLAQPLLPDGSLGAVTDVGAAERETIEFAEAAPAIEGCRTSAGLVVRLRSAGGYLAFQGKDGWKAPVPTGGRGSMTCSVGATGPEATVTSGKVQEQGATFRLAVEQELCTSAGCGFSRGTVTMNGDLGPTDRSRIAAVGLDGKVLLVWAGGSRGGIRMRLARAMDIGQAPDTIVFDDQIVGGKVVRNSTLQDFLLVGRDDFAVLLLSTTVGVHVLRIDKTGTVTPVSVQ